MKLPSDYTYTTPELSPQLRMELIEQLIGLNNSGVLSKDEIRKMLRDDCEWSRNKEEELLGTHFLNRGW